MTTTRNDHGIRLLPSRELYPHLNGSLPVLVIDNAASRTVIAPQGAHVLSFTPAGGRDMLWQSPKAIMARGQPIRGGIPLCLPWFGPSPQGHPMHGFARLLAWAIEDVETQKDGATRLTLALADSEATRAMWPHAFAFTLEIVAGKDLKLTLSATNAGPNAARFEFAFHTYFNVGDVAKAIVTGLEGCTFEDREDKGARKRQEGPLTIAGTTTSLYLDVPAVQQIESPVATYRIESDARCCMVWNAGDNDRTIPDLGAGNHMGYLCVERADAVERAVDIAPGGTYRTTMTLGATP
ncbi:MAG: D-hexose-6-phosphate mutarotase [Rhodospirillales bacterium]|nr:D-hexose-6-phosphate mutarotase [Rhodospirillales bacterium]